MINLKPYYNKIAKLTITNPVVWCEASDTMEMIKKSRLISEQDKISILEKLTDNAISK